MRGHIHRQAALPGSGNTGDCHKPRLVEELEYRSPLTLPANEVGAEHGQVGRPSLQRPGHAEIRREALDIELIHVLTTIEVLQIDLAQVAERHAVGQSCLAQQPSWRRDQCLSAVRAGADARGAVYVQTDVVVATQGGDTRVDAHPDPYVAAVRP